MESETNTLSLVVSSKKCIPHASLCDNSDIEHRNRSFTNAPIIYSPHREELAKRGFMFTANQTVSCYLCSGDVGNVNDLDNIGECHTQKCQFYQERENVEEIKTKKERINFAALSTEEKENLGEIFSVLS